MEGDEFYRRPELLVQVVHGQRKKKGAVRKKKRGACPAGAGKNGDGGRFPFAAGHLLRRSLLLAQPCSGLNDMYSRLNVIVKDINALEISKIDSASINRNAPPEAQV